MKPKIYLSMLGWKQVVGIKEPKEIPPLIIQSINNLPYWSYDALRKLHIGIQEMIIDFCKEERENKKGSQKGKLTRIINRAEKVIQFTPRDRLILLQNLYNIILSFEGMSNLHRRKY